MNEKKTKFQRAKSGVLRLIEKDEDTKKLVEDLAQKKGVSSEEMLNDMAGMFVMHKDYLEQVERLDPSAGKGTQQPNNADVSHEETNNAISDFLKKYGIDSKHLIRIKDKLLGTLTNSSQIPSASYDSSNSNTGPTLRYKLFLYCVRFIVAVVDEDVGLYGAIKIIATGKK